ncbi:unnamed protein product [Nezara viridula]|uniref:Ribosomal protein eL8/eL30/eS12/Gadd45 domain-containing protein n=1 Tax=Nezara viridula TaxID=85310 RepID=A0A9P0EBS7_NEZVI|nr:unnamed protein product [Nezara viridula]
MVRHLSSKPNADSLTRTCRPKGVADPRISLVIFAGDVMPIDIMSHLPGVCEDKEVPYCYMPSRKDLGAAMGVNRSVVTVMVKPKDVYSELYEEVLGEIKALPLPI